MFPLFFRLVLKPIIHIFCVDHRHTSYISFFNMVQVKFSAVFIIAAAIIVPVLSLPSPVLFAGEEPTHNKDSGATNHAANTNVPAHTPQLAINPRLWVILSICPMIIFDFITDIPGFMMVTNTRHCTHQVKFRVRIRVPGCESLYMFNTDNTGSFTKHLAW